MRILSQDNLPFRDLPYENVTVYTDDDEKEVRALFGNVVYVIAKYSTEAKARKAMEMLREQYAKLCSLTTYLHGGMELFAKSISQQEAEDFATEYKNMNVFQFPSDEEVEV